MKILINETKDLNNYKLLENIKCDIEIRNSKCSLLYYINNNLKINDSIDIVINIKKEPLGCVVIYGFEINSMREIKNYTYKVNIKKIENIKKFIKYDYSWLIKLPRTGKDGKKIYVYKLRTMQPYSEYIQDLVIKYNGLNKDGTIINDFRITKIGKFLRKYWIDELPMLINWIKGDLKLIGIRPLSDSMLNKYPKDFVKIRNNYKPGLIPPYYIDSPKSFNELIESEKRYLKKYDNNGFIIDIKYFFMFLNKVIFKGIRSS